MNILKTTYNIFKSFIIRNRLKKADDVLSDGERYDPVLNGWIAKDHLNRYTFARSFISKNDSVLDIACGTGYGSQYIKDRCKKYTGVDKHTGCIEYGMNKYGNENVKFIISDFFSYDVKADVVLSFETIEHITVDSIDLVLGKLVSLSGRMIIGSVPYKEKKGNNKYHYFYGLDESFFNVLKKHGDVSFFYQIDGGCIFDEKPLSERIMQLVFVFEKEVEKENETRRIESNKGNNEC